MSRCLMRSDTRKRSVPKVGRGLHRQKLPVQHCHFEATSTASSRRDLNPANVAPSLLSQVVYSSCSVCSLRTLRPLDAPLKLCAHAASAHRERFALFRRFQDVYSCNVSLCVTARRVHLSRSLLAAANPSSVSRTILYGLAHTSFA